MLQPDEVKIENTILYMQKQTVNFKIATTERKKKKMKKSDLLKQSELKDSIKKQVLAECIEFCEDRGIDSEKLQIFLCNMPFRLDLENQIMAHFEGVAPTDELKRLICLELNSSAKLTIEDMKKAIAKIEFKHTLSASLAVTVAEASRRNDLTAEEKADLVYKKLSELLRNSTTLSSQTYEYILMRRELERISYMFITLFRQQENAI